MKFGKHYDVVQRLIAIIILDDVKNIAFIVGSIKQIPKIMDELELYSKDISASFERVSFFKCTMNGKTITFMENPYRKDQ